MTLVGMVLVHRRPELHLCCQSEVLHEYGPTYLFLLDHKQLDNSVSIHRSSHYSYLLGPWEDNAAGLADMIPFCDNFWE